MEFVAKEPSRFRAYDLPKKYTPELFAQAQAHLDAAAKKLAKRTLTNLYNERPTWLDLAHKRLDEAVFAAYGWPADLTEIDLLARLLALNLERALPASD